MRYILLLAICLLSCSENEDECLTCVTITESNDSEARLNCQGLANNYPTFTETARMNHGKISMETRASLENSLPDGFVIERCSGIIGETRSRLSCN